MHVSKGVQPAISRLRPELGTNDIRSLACSTGDEEGILVAVDQSCSFPVAQRSLRSRAAVTCMSRCVTGSRGFLYSSSLSPVIKVPEASGFRFLLDRFFHLS